jgi:U3 small nucleolar RNA-associated protein 21
MPVQAFLRVVLQIHGEAIMEHEQLRQRASQIEQHLRKSWTRIETLVEQTRCMVGLLSNQQF